MTRRRDIERCILTIRDYSWVLEGYKVARRVERGGKRTRRTRIPKSHLLSVPLASLLPWVARAQVVVREVYEGNAITAKIH